MPRLGPRGDAGAIRFGVPVTDTVRDCKAQAIAADGQRRLIMPERAAPAAGRWVRDYGALTSGNVRDY
jgi:hypothetical protein